MTEQPAAARTHDAVNPLDHKLHLHQSKVFDHSRVRPEEIASAQSFMEQGRTKQIMHMTTHVLHEVLDGSNPLALKQASPAAHAQKPHKRSDDQAHDDASGRRRHRTHRGSRSSCARGRRLLRRCSGLCCVSVRVCVVRWRVLGENALGGWLYLLGLYECV